VTPERWGRIVDLFSAVADLPAALRVECLTYECRGEPDLRREIDTLLRADRIAGDGAYIRRAVDREMDDLRLGAPADGHGERRAGPRDDAGGGDAEGRAPPRDDARGA
jgi:hypothetical protein